VTAERPDAISILALDAARLDELREHWLELHRAARTVSAVPLQPDDELSWQVRRRSYAGWLAAGTEFAIGAERASRLVGYAVVRVHDGPDDTFDFGSGYAELYSLSVLPAERNGGIGTRLLDEVDRELAGRGITSLAIAVVAGNDAARRLYERRGLVAGEVMLYRIAPVACRPNRIAAPAEGRS
jgi:ribosomal protein S18 acetylase RimI-like enzyme